MSQSGPLTLIGLGRGDGSGRGDCVKDGDERMMLCGACGIVWCMVTSGT
jgi:hypothetical protein